MDDELLDLINNHNQVVGTVTKSVAHRDGLLHRIVIGELINSKGEYCFVQQAGDRQDPGQFVSPIGGHVGAGESTDAALIRECQEECGFTPTDFMLVDSTIYSREVIGRKENHFFLVYQIPFSSNPVLNHESISYKWFSVNEIKQTLKNNPQTFGAAWHHVFKNIFPAIYSI
ncbi:MAG: NUDIX hydrolase [uncultured bacterium]|nr:MAG: NUDIX hydrolase [uncultured bacterium]